MVFREGFGSITATVTDATATPNEQLATFITFKKSEFTRWIQKITAVYCDNGENFEKGRLLIMDRIYTNVAGMFSPYTPSFPALAGQVLYNRWLNGKETEIDFGQPGFPILPGSEATIVLVAAATVAEGWPSFNGGVPDFITLNAYGNSTEKADPYGELR